jgi:drug/metabolite transporter (DMT)-like permease
MPTHPALNPATLLLIVGTIALLAVGQVLFKYAATTLQPADWHSWLSLPLLGALAVYGVATVAWLAVLTRVPLSVAFPFYGLGFVLVPLLSVLLLGEGFRWSTLAGGAIIAIGIVVSCGDW